MTQSIIQRAVENDDPKMAREALLEIESRLASSSDVEERIYLLFSRANCQVVLGDFSDAQRSLDIAVRARPDEASRTNYDWMQAVIAQRQGNYADAIRQFSAVLEAHASVLQNPEWRFLYEDIQLRRGFLLVSLSKFADALAFLNESLSFEINETVRSELEASLGICHLELENLDTAKTHLDQADDRALSGDWKWRIHYYRGIVNYHSGELGVSKKEFKVCEELAAAYSVPILDVYGWLAAVCKALGETTESSRYATLRKRN